MYMKSKITNTLEQSIMDEGYVSFNEDTNSRYISPEDMKDFIDNLCNEIAEYIKNVGILSDGSLDSIMLLGLGFPHDSKDIRILCAKYNLETHFDNMAKVLMSMHKARVVKDGMLDLTSAQMSKMVLQNEYDYYGEKSLSQTNNTTLNISAVASSLGTTAAPMKQLDNNNENMFKALTIEASDYIVEGTDE